MDCQLHQPFVVTRKNHHKRHGGQFSNSVVPVFYFIRKNDSRLRLARARFEKGILAKALANGSSEMVTNLSVSIVSILYNFKLMMAAGEDGVAAYGIIMYVNIIFMAVFLGYAIGSAPVAGFHYGAGRSPPPPQ